MSVGISGRFVSGGLPLWPEARKAEIEEIVSRYPEAKSAIMPLLHLAQSERGFVAQEDLEAIAEILELPVAYVESTASFYAMYHGHPVGRYVVVLCTNLSCHLNGARQIQRAFEQELGIRSGETTPDGLITLEATSECLAACDGAPCAQVNVEYFLRLTPEKVGTLVKALREGDGKTVAALAEHPAAGEAIVKESAPPRVEAGRAPGGGGE